MNKASRADMNIVQFTKSVETLREALAVTDPTERKAALKAYYFPNRSAGYEYALIFVNWVIAGALFKTIANELIVRPVELSWLVLAVPVAFFLADFMSAFFHKWLDSFASETNRFWGNAAKAFRIHHEFPMNLNDTTYLHNVSAFAPFITMLYGVYACLLCLFALPAPLSLTAWLMLLLFANGTEIHKRAHCKTRSAGFRFLQHLGFFLRRKSHLKHHARSHNSDYGIINGWSNGFLNALRIWDRMDLLVWRSFGVFPRNWIHDPSSVPDEVVKSFNGDPRRVPPGIAVYLNLYDRKVAPELQRLLEVPEGRKPSLRMRAR